APNRAARPSGALTTRPFPPPSAPRMQARSSRSISSYSASRTACTRLRSGIGIHMPAERPWVGVSRSLSRLGGSLDLTVDLLAKAGIGLRRQPAPLHQRIPHPGDRITRGFRSELCRIAVGPLVIIGGMRLQAQHFCLDQAGALAGAGALGRLSHGQVHGEEIIAVDAHAAAAAAEIARRLTAAAGGVGGPGERRQHQLFGGEAAGQGGGEVSVVETETISAWLERRNCRDLGHLVPAWRNNEGQFPGAIQ